MTIYKEFSALFSIPSFLKHFDMVFGIFNVGQILLAIIDYYHNVPSLLSIASLTLFLLFNSVISLASYRFKGTSRVPEKIRIIGGLLVAPLVFLIQVPVLSPWWPAFYIMTIGGITFLCLTYNNHKLAILLIVYYTVASFLIEYFVFDFAFLSIFSRVGQFVIVSIIYFLILTQIGNSVFIMIELQKAKESIVRLREENARLKSAELMEKIENKDKELAVYSLNFIQKNQLIENVKNEFYDLKVNKINNQVGKINGISKMLEDGFRIDKDWSEFKIHYEGIHKDFFKKLKESYPDLTPTDLKLCALIKVNLSTKEIARMLGVLPESIKTARYRIRKKVGLKNSDNLFDFLNSIETATKQIV